MYFEAARFKPMSSNHFEIQLQARHPIYTNPASYRYNLATEDRARLSATIASLILLGIFFSFFSLWLLVCTIVSILGGWSALARQFRFDGEFRGVSRDSQNGQMQASVNYWNCMRMGANQEGLYLAVSRLFRFMHPPLLVPWHEIRRGKDQGWIPGGTVTIILGRQQEISLTIPGQTAQLFRDTAGSAWPLEET